MSNSYMTNTDPKVNNHLQPDQSRKPPQRKNRGIQHGKENTSSEKRDLALTKISDAPSASTIDAHSTSSSNHHNNFRTPDKHKTGRGLAQWRRKGNQGSEQSDGNHQTKTNVAMRSGNFSSSTSTSFSYASYTPKIRSPKETEFYYTPSVPNSRSREYKPLKSFVLRGEADPDILKGLQNRPLWRLSLEKPLEGSSGDGNTIVISFQDEKPDDSHRGLEPRNVIPVASYNWTDENEPTIIVPGCPPIWQGKPTPFTLDRDDGASFIDPNRYRAPLYPLLPLILAIEHLSPQFDFSSVDIITDRNNIRKLIRWIGGTIDRDFRINLQLRGRTILMERTEPTSLERDSGRLGYGRNFESYMTKSLIGCEKSVSHHRIISYDYGDLKLLVRFEVDACLHFDQATQQRNDSSEIISSNATPKDELVAALDKLTISEDHLHTNDDIRIVHGGVFVPQSSLIEMSTKSEVGNIDWEQSFPQLFFSQTPHYYLAFHQRGRFRRILNYTLKDEISETQQKVQQHSFDKLYILLKEIRRLVLFKGEDIRLSLVFRVSKKTFEVYEGDTKRNLLPEGMMELFERRVRS